MGISRLRRCASAAVAAGLTALAAAGHAGDGFPAVKLTPVVGGLRAPLHLTHAGDGGARLYVVEQGGTIRIIDDGRLLAEPFLDIRARVESGGEKGLLSVAFDPRFRDSRTFYVNYTARDGGLVSRIARFTAESPLRADPGSERALLSVAQPYGNHNGGQLAFGPDGMLYVGLGDGGSANDPRGHGQDLGTLLGAILRIDVTRHEADRAYAIPSDNPFRGRSGARPEIWAYGLRNPWRFSFDAATGRLYAADVGQNAREEVNVIERGGNYGWRIMEGDICTPGVSRRCDPDRLIAPIAVYDHSQGRSITGGFVYRGKAIPGLRGAYLYGDYVSGHVWALRYDGERVTARTRLLADTGHAISSFGEGPDGELYLVDHRAGAVLRIDPR